jgi:metallophosphoesterase (TIGR03768 family)
MPDDRVKEVFDGCPVMKDGYLYANEKPGWGTARLLNFFSMSDVHIGDVQSPAQVLYVGLEAPFGAGRAVTSAWTPTMLSTTQVLDAAIQTANALHRQTPFDFGIFLGDAINSTQYNELRWYIDTIDGKTINPDSSHPNNPATGGPIDYMNSFQAAGLDPSIPWYQVVGNHDQFFVGSWLTNDYVRTTLVGSNIINLGNTATSDLNSRGYYMGVVDGTTPYGDVIGYGPVGQVTPPQVIANSDRHSLATSTSTTLQWMTEFFNTASSPKGHGFTQSNLDNDAAYYTFKPRADIPIRVIVFDDTCKANQAPLQVSTSHHYYAQGCVDQTRYDWLVSQLQAGQVAGELMIVAAHIPAGPQVDLYNPAIASELYVTPATASAPAEAIPPYNVKTDAQLLATLHQYPNVLMWIAGHAHRNVVTPQPSPDPARPELGFWEVETPSLRDYPQEFRMFDIRRNADNTVSILVTDVDPAAAPGSPAAKGHGYAVGSWRVFGGVDTFADISSQSYNAELIKTLSPEMQAQIASLGSPLSGVAITGVANSGSGTPGIESGSWVSIYGTKLSGTTRGWQASDFQGSSLPLMLDGVSVTINGKPAAVAYVSPGQLNVLAPTDTATGSVLVEVLNSAGSAVAFANLQSYAPAFFKSGKYAVAVHADGAYVAPEGFFGAGVASRPARPGEAISLYGTGFGPTAPAVPAGQIVGSPAPLATPNGPEIRVGSSVSAIQFAGLVAAGVYQFNIVVPPLPDGDAPVMAQIGGAGSLPGVWLPIRK